MRLERLARVRLRRALMPYSRVKVSMVLNSKDIPLHLYVKDQSPKHMKNGVNKDGSGGTETSKEPVVIQMRDEGSGPLS